MFQSDETSCVFLARLHKYIYKGLIVFFYYLTHPGLTLKSTVYFENLLNNFPWFRFCVLIEVIIISTLGISRDVCTDGKSLLCPCR